ncbi:hypothetical protein [Lichenifustis flavocetrariae]|uniref:Uncharacterized protein n=1 Tax=Lichenifustis flavocetrariae TaxID=2949735 RepID=A0AA41Z2D7_9HYPH|nr:hypothetical protein [Lichenifustis flavocetrariae]MCW6511726.1 hypothetical protein [Lichenifustis flavocetrariae]
MNTQTSNALASWLALSANDRTAFERARLALTAAAPQPSLEPDAAPPQAPATRESEPVTQRIAQPQQLSLLPLPPSASPRRGRLAPPPVDTALFASEAYRAIAGGGGTALAYVAGCRGMAQIYEEIHTTFYKAGSTSASAIAARMRSLNDAGYASYRRLGNEVVAEPEFDGWSAASLPLHGPRPPNSPVTGLGNALQVLLPAGMTHEAFDIALTEHLWSVSLATIAAKPAFRLTCIGRGFDIGRLQRFTLKQDKSGFKAACELVRLSPRWEADAFADLIEGIIADFVLARSRARNPSPMSRHAIER